MLRHRLNILAAYLLVVMSLPNPQHRISDYRAEITVNFADPPHRDIPKNSKICAQIVIEDSIFAQTIAVDSLDEGGNSWKLGIECNMYVG